MSSHKWKNLCASLFGRGRSEAPEPEAAGGSHASPAPADTAAAAPVAPEAPDDPKPAAERDRPAPPARPSEETQVSLQHSLKWRSQVLLNTPGIDDPKGDGRRLVDSLLETPDTVIRQLPQAAQKAIRVSRDPNSGTRDLVLLFERDPTLTQTLLKRANSPWYRRGPESIVSITAAVQRIGAKGVENVFLESVVRGLLCRPGGVYNRMVSAEWAVMLNSATQARHLARSFRVDADSAHSLGLLHDVGKLVCFDRISIMRGTLRRDVEITDSFLSVLLDRLHEPLGAQACLQWGMGGEAAYAVAHHHRQPCPEGHEPMTELLYVADHLDLTAPTEEAWEEVWREGAITADRETIQRAFRNAA